jgi:coenzyme F420-0:L-glutamate ligase/coenzyme F420-1:gamma-L-glutamate ligase
VTGLTVVPLPLDAEVVVGDDLAAHLLTAVAVAGVELDDGDVLCVASKVVAKAEGASVPLPPGDPDAARRTLAREHAVRVVAETPWVLVVETHHGFVCANAGIDASNVADAGTALLLPEDPDASAAALRAELHVRTGADVGVVVTDTFGRPWRMGQVDVALGAAGVVALRDDRGGRDRDGRPLAVTMVAVADQLAAAADLVRSKADGTPFVLLRGLRVAGPGDAADLLRPAAQDVFRHGGPTAIEVALRAAHLGPAPGTEPRLTGATLDRLADAARGAVLPVTVSSDPDGLLLVSDDPLAVGAALQAVATLAGALDVRVTTGPTATGARVRLGAPGAAHVDTRTTR